MKKIYIHIGIGKTGTTSIQEFLIKNTPNLDLNDYFYLKTGNLDSAHHKLSFVTTETLDWDDITSTYQMLIEEIMGSNFNNYILNSEYFCSSSPKIISYLGKIFLGFDICIIFYTQQQPNLIQKTYLQFIKAGKDTHGRNFQYSLNEFYGGHSKAFDFSKVIAPWEEVFGQSAIKASLYHPEIVGDDVRRHFLGQVGITDPELISQLNFDQERANPSIHPLLSDLVTVIDQNESLNNRPEIIEEVLNISEHIKGIKCSLFTPEQEVEIRDYYAESNAAFADKYLTLREKELLLGAESTKVTSGKKKDSGIIYEKDVPSKILNNQLSKLTQEHDKLTKGFEALTQEKDALTDQLNIHVQEKNTLTQNLNSFASENESLRIQLASAIHVNKELQNSTSWKITSPIRYVKRKILGGRS